jgi:hypothetical protein
MLVSTPSIWPGSNCLCPAVVFVILMYLTFSVVGGGLGPVGFSEVKRESNQQVSRLYVDHSLTFDLPMYSMDDYVYHRSLNYQTRKWMSVITLHWNMALLK